MIDLSITVNASPRRMKILFREMFQVWRSVPNVACKGLCQRQCGNVPLMPIEATYIEQKYHVSLPVAIHGENVGRDLAFKTLGINIPCPFLSEYTHAGRCTIYNDRPVICRAY